jgi:FHA domain
LKSNEEGERLLNDIIKDIEEQCKLGEQELLRAKRQVEAENQLQLVVLPTTAMPLEKDVNNRRDFVVQAAVATNKVEPVSKKEAATSAPLGTVHVDIVAGPYMGKTFTLKVTSRAPRLVGRSQSKNFRDKGISLSKDLEVSTSHGKFVLIKDKVYFVDTESTNGTLVSESGDNTSSNDHTTTDQMEPNEPYQLSTGTMITCGQTVMKITLP